MCTITVALIAFACSFAGALLGLLINAFLPDHHLSGDARDVVKLGAGLIATLAAFVLGLLMSTANTALNSMNFELTQDSAKIIMLDRTLADYGPETKEVRKLLRNSVVTAIKHVWPEEKPINARMENSEVGASLEIIQKKMRGLSPQDETQRLLKAQVLQTGSDLAQSRWLLIEQSQGALPATFLVVLLFWLTILFAGFGMLAPRNATVIAVLLICALSVSGAIFLIYEMNNPFEGMIKISSAPLRKALDHLGK
jgi:hypothetical protein